jgi:hypothetical protein
MTIDERLKKVEGQLARVRWVNRCLIGFIVLSVGAWSVVKTFGPETAWAQSAMKEIRANKFVLEDENGKERAALGVNEYGPELLLHDENSKMSARLLVSAEGPALVLRENGKTRAELGVLNDTPQLVLLDENGQPRTALSVDKDGPKLGLFEKNGKPIWEVP